MAIVYSKIPGECSYTLRSLDHKHRVFLTKTSLGNFIQCETCFYISDEFLEKDCINYVDPVEKEKKTRDKKEADRIKKVNATIEWLKKNGKGKK